MNYGCRGRLLHVLEPFCSVAHLPCPCLPQALVLISDDEGGGGQDTSALQRSRRCRPYHLARLLEGLLIGRLIKSEDLLSEVLVRSMSFLVGPEEAQRPG